MGIQGRRSIPGTDQRAARLRRSKNDAAQLQVIELAINGRSSKNPRLACDGGRSLVALHSERPSIESDIANLAAEELNHARTVRHIRGQRDQPRDVLP